MAILSQHHFFFSSTTLPRSRTPLFTGDSLANLTTATAAATGSAPVATSHNGRNCSSRFVVLSAHSNPKILKSNRRTRFGEPLSPYDSDDVVGGVSGDVVDEDDDDSDDDWSSDDDDEDIDGQKTKKVQKGTNIRQGYKQAEKRRGTKSLRSGQSLILPEAQLQTKNGKYTSEKRNTGNLFSTSNRTKDVGSLYQDGKVKSKGKKATENRFSRLAEEIDLDEKCFPLLDYLTTFGIKESHFIQMYERHMPSLQINVSSARERLEYLLSVGVKPRDIGRILLRQPQILQYTVEKNLKSHVAFLLDLGIPESRIGQIITSSPSLFSYSVENSLKPTARYLVEEVGIKKNDLAKVVQLSPQILVQRIDDTWKTRYGFFSKELGAPRDSVVKMVRKHPQLLHYSIEDGLLPRINFLRSIGMRNSEILKVLTSLTQVLSLSLEDNLRPKYMYLINELRNEVQSLTKYPTYLSLSLDQRIRPRHRFLVSLKKAPKGPFPLSSLVPTDESFCQQWAGTSLDQYLAFRQRLLLKDFAKKYEKQR